MAGGRYAGRMILGFGKRPTDDVDYEKLYRELRHTMQDIVIAHAAACYKHMTPEQLTAVQADWAKLIRGKGWAAFFTDEIPIAPAPRWQTMGE